MQKFSDSDSLSAKCCHQCRGRLEWQPKTVTAQVSRTLRWKDWSLERLVVGKTGRWKDWSLERLGKMLIYNK